MTKLNKILGHNFIPLSRQDYIELGFDKSKSYNDYKCTTCNLRGFEEKFISRIFYKINGETIPLLLSCDEIIIKNILE